MIWILIPLAAFLGWIFIEYQENKISDMADKQKLKAK